MILIRLQCFRARARSNLCSGASGLCSTVQRVGFALGTGFRVEGFLNKPKPQILNPEP